MKTKVLGRKWAAISLVLAASIGVGAQAANADTIEVPVTLSGDVVRFVETNNGAAIDSAGDILDASGNVVGVVYGPDNKVVHDVSGNKVVIIKHRGADILSASLYNRLIDLQNLLASEKALGHLSADKYDALWADIRDARTDLDAKVASGGLLSFDESLEIGADLDTIASRVKSEIRNPTIAEVVYRPMVITTDPSKKRIAIYQRTVQTSDGVTRTTQTTKTETTTE
jgi:hypothetical protein